MRDNTELIKAIGFCEAQFIILEIESDEERIKQKAREAKKQLQEYWEAYQNQNLKGNVKCND